MDMAYLVAIFMDPTLPDDCAVLTLSEMERSYEALADAYKSSYFRTKYIVDGEYRLVKTACEMIEYLRLRNMPGFAMAEPVHVSRTPRDEIYMKVAWDMAEQAHTSVPAVALLGSPHNLQAMHAKLATLLIAIPYLVQHPNPVISDVLVFYSNILRGLDKYSVHTGMGLFVCFRQMTEAHLTICVDALFKDDPLHYPYHRPPPLAVGVRNHDTRTSNRVPADYDDNDDDNFG
jgi:hypothetical protein